MNFDKFLDFLFHKFLGIAFAFCGTMLAVFALSSCIPLDCAGCFCETACGEGCGDCYIDCSEECDMLCYECFEAFSCTSGDGNGVLDCLLGDGCYRTCGDCYTECGGINITCWRAVCTEGICPSCTTDYYGDLVCTYLNCTTYCGGKSGYDDDYDDYYDDSDCDGCGGCGGCSGSSGSGSSGNNGSSGSNSNNRTYYYSIELYALNHDYYTYRDVYSDTYYLPYKSYDGYEFRGYYTELNGQGRQITDSEGYLLDKYNYAYTGYAYYVPLKQQINVEIYKNGEWINSSTITSGANLEDFVLRYLYESQEFNSLNAYFDVNGYQYQLYSYGTYQFPSVSFDPQYIGATSGYSVKLYLSSMIVVNIRDPYNTYHEYQVPYGITAGELRAYAPTVSGMLLAGFCYENGNGEILTENTAITTNATLYAVYSEQISFKLVDDYGNVKNETVASGSYYTLPVPDYTQTGMKFVGWYSESGYLANGNTLNKNNPISNTIKIDGAFSGVTLIPAWSPEIYNIRYYVNGSLYHTETYTYGNSHALLENVYEEFMAFNGWTESSSLNGNTVSSISAYDYGDKTFYATFTPKVFTLDLNASNGNVDPNTVSITYGLNKSQYAIQIPTRSGYEFLGWCFTKNGVDTMLTKADGVGILNFNKDDLGINTEEELNALELRAVWDVETYKVTFKVNGTVYTTQSVEHGSKATEPTAPSVTGYSFGGWLGLGGVPFNFNTAITSDMELNAKLNPKQYKIILSLPNDANEWFHWSDGDESSYYGQEYEVFCTYGDSMAVDWEIEVKPYNDSGKTFLGWSYNGELVIDAMGNVVNKELLDSIPTDSKGKITLVATWG